MIKLETDKDHVHMLGVKKEGSANSVELCKHLGLQRESHSRCTGHGYEVPSKKAHPESPRQGGWVGKF